MKSIIVQMVSVVVFCFSPAVNSAVIFDNGGSADSAGFRSDPSSSQWFEAADDFVLAAGTELIRDVHWWGGYALGTAPLADDFTINVYADNSGVPGTLQATRNPGAVNRIDTGRDFTLTGVSDDPVYEYWADVNPITLVAGTTYWLGISNNSGGNDWTWAFSSSQQDQFVQSYSNNLGAWVPGGFQDVAFQLTNDVPEPATLALLSLGLLGIGFRSLRKS